MASAEAPLNGSHERVKGCRLEAGNFVPESGGEKDVVVNNPAVEKMPSSSNMSRVPFSGGRKEAQLSQPCRVKCLRAFRPSSASKPRAQSHAKIPSKRFRKPARVQPFVDECAMRCCFLPELRSRVCFVRGDRQSVLSLPGCVYFRDHERRGMVFQDMALSRFGPFTTPPPRSQQCGI